MSSNRNIANNILAFSSLTSQIDSVIDMINQESSGKKYKEFVTPKEIGRATLGIGGFLAILLAYSYLPKTDTTNMAPGHKVEIEFYGMMLNFVVFAISLIPLGYGVSSLDFKPQPLFKLSKNTLEKTQELLDSLHNLDELNNIDLSSSIEAFLKEVSIIRQQTSTVLKGLENALQRFEGKLHRRELLQNDMKVYENLQQSNSSQPLSKQNISDLVKLSEFKTLSFISNLTNAGNKKNAVSSDDEYRSSIQNRS